MIEFFSYDNLLSLVQLIQAKVKIRLSEHSFTDYVIEAHYADDYSLQAVWLAREIEAKTGQFVAIRIVSPSAAYISIPIDPLTVPF